MERILDDAAPIGAPGGGPESFRFPSCMASLSMSLEGKGRHDVDARDYHMGLYHLYVTVSGIGLSAVWSDDLHPGTFNTLVGLGDDDYVARSMGFAGYVHRDLGRDAGRDALWQAITSSVEAGVPVLAHSLVGSEWSLVTGYDGDALVGWHESWYGRDWEASAPQPDGYLENGMFHKRDWCKATPRVVTVERVAEPSRSWGTLIHSLAGVLERRQAPGLHAGSDAYAAALHLLRDDAWFELADETSLRRAYRHVHGFVGHMAEARCSASFTFACGDCGGQHARRGARGEAKCADTLTFARLFRDAPGARDLPRRLRRIARLLMGTHDTCLDAWTAMGGSYLLQPERYAGRLRDRGIRREVARHVERMAENDAKTLLELRECLPAG